MIPNGKQMDWNGHKLTFESEHDRCSGCFFENKNECPDCDEGIWVEKGYPWHTGTPIDEIKENDWYTFAYKWNGEIRYITVKEPSFWYFTNCDTLAWQKVEPYKEKS